ncbi:MAG TPA: hypothetical protein DDW31_06975 [candidate division Zixibacteria bacterium]|nr:hypothetical protein [candidate division Zixibacteria bacterium]
MTKMPRTLLAAAAAVMLAAGAMVAQQSAVHRVIDGDTLWDLAGHYLQNSFSWPLIWEANKDKVEDPHWIYPGQELAIPPLGAAGPVAEPDTSAPVAAPAAEQPEMPEPEEPAARPVAEMRRSQLIGLRKAATPVVSEALAFISGYLSTEEEKPLGRFIHTDVKQAEFLNTNDRVYINLGVRDGTRPGDRFAVYRVDKKRVKHPKGGADLGRMVTIAGVVEVEQVEEQSSKARIVRCFQPLTRKETLKPYVEAVVPKDVKPMPVQKSHEGYIVALREPEMAATTYKVAYIDKGLADGIIPGDVFEIYRVQKNVPDPDRGGSVRLSDLTVGALQVLSVRNNTSTAYISASSVEDIKTGETIRLVKKVPGR